MSQSPQRPRRTAEQNINSLGYPPHYNGSDTPTASFAPPTTQAPLKRKNIVKPLPRSEIEAAFQFFDIHNKKRITASDLKERLSPFYPHLANKEYKFLVSEGDFTIDTLMEVLNHQVLRDFDPVREAFKVFDPHDTGYMDKNILKKVLKGLGYGEITNEDLKVLVETADVDGDGRISIDDWRNMTEFDVTNRKRKGPPETKQTAREEVVNDDDVLGQEKQENDEANVSSSALDDSALQEDENEN